MRPPGTDEPYNVVALTEVARDGELEERLYVVDLVRQRVVGTGGCGHGWVGPHPQLSAMRC